jgi:hypothetical protein
MFSKNETSSAVLYEIYGICKKTCALHSLGATVMAGINPAPAQ